MNRTKQQAYGRILSRLNSQIHRIETNEAIKNGSNRKMALDACGYIISDVSKINTEFEWYHFLCGMLHPEPEVLCEALNKILSKSDFDDYNAYIEKQGENYPDIFKKKEKFEICEITSTKELICFDWEYVNKFLPNLPYKLRKYFKIISIDPNRA